MVHKNVYHLFSARLQKICSFRGLKIEGVRNSVVPHSSQFDSFSARSIGHVFFMLVHVGIANPPPPGTAYNIGCAATSVNNGSLDKVNVKHPLQHDFIFSCPKIPKADNLQLERSFRTTPHQLISQMKRILMQYLQNAIRRHHSQNTKHTRTCAHIMNT